MQQTTTLANGTADRDDRVRAHASRIVAAKASAFGMSLARASLLDKRGGRRTGQTERWAVAEAVHYGD